MTENSVSISITISVATRTMKKEANIRYEELEERIQGLAIEISQNLLGMGLEEIDKQLFESKPKKWQNLGTETRWLVSSVGELRYKRRVYLDENRQRRKPLDELLGIGQHERMSGRVQEMGASLACTETYRLAASQLSWLIKTPISHSTLQRMAWRIGERIADGEDAARRRVFESGGQVESGKIEAPVLYGESDGVWVPLQREKRRSAEVRLAIMSTGKKAVGKDRYRLENKRCTTAIGVDSQSWQEQVLMEAHLQYDLERTKILITGGDGNQWVRQTFKRLDLPQEFILDSFHLHRAARQALQNREEAKAVVKRLREEGFEGIQQDLLKKISRAEGRRKEKLKDFYKYIQHNRDGLRDLEHRGVDQSACLGAIEGNVDKFVVHRLKGRGCSWRYRGLRAMLALRQNYEALQQHAYRYFPVQSTIRQYRRTQRLEVEYDEVLQKSMPIFSSADQFKPWVRELHRHIHCPGSLFLQSRGI